MFPLKKGNPDLKHIRSPSQDILLSCYTSKIQFLSPELQDVSGMLSQEPEFVLHPLPAASSIRLCMKVLERYSLQSVLRKLCYSFHKCLWPPGKVQFRSLESTTFAEEKNDQHNSDQEFFPYARQHFSIHPVFTLNHLMPLYSPSTTTAQTAMKSPSKTQNQQYSPPQSQAADRLLNNADRSAF